MLPKIRKCLPKGKAKKTNVSVSKDGFGDLKFLHRDKHESVLEKPNNLGTIKSEHSLEARLELEEYNE